MSAANASRAADERWDLVASLIEVATSVRDAVRGSSIGHSDAEVVRHEGGDDVFGIDGRADEALRAAFDRLDSRWAGSLVCEGFDQPLPVAGGRGPWRFLADPIDGTRAFLAGKHSAWVLMGAGRDAATLEDLEVGVAIEIPGRNAAAGLVAGAVRGAGVEAYEADLIGAGAGNQAIELEPTTSRDLSRRFVTVVRLLPGGHGPIGAFADEVLAGLEVYDDLSPCTGGQFMGLARGADSAVFDPRPEFGQRLCAHPYDLAALVVAREAGVIVEPLLGGQFAVPLDTETNVSWAGYANEGVAEFLRPRILAALG